MEEITKGTMQWLLTEGSLQPAHKFLGDNITENSLMAPLWLEKIILENVFSDQHIVT